MQMPPLTNLTSTIYYPDGSIEEVSGREYPNTARPTPTPKPEGYIDCTELTRITIDFIREKIETELPSELRYLTMYDEIRAKMRDIVEMPDRHN